MSAPGRNCTGTLARKCPKKVLGKRFWQRRYFVLSSQHKVLSYYVTSREGLKPIGEIPLQAVESVLKVDNDKKHSSRRFSIKLSGGWVFELRADSRAEKERWILAIKEGIEDIKFRDVIDSFKDRKYWKPDVYKNIKAMIQTQKMKSQKIREANDKYATKVSAVRTLIVKDVQSAVEDLNKRGYSRSTSGKSMAKARTPTKSKHSNSSRRSTPPNRKVTAGREQKALQISTSGCISPNNPSFPMEGIGLISPGHFSPTIKSKPNLDGSQAKKSESRLRRTKMKGQLSGNFTAPSQMNSMEQLDVVMQERALKRRQDGSLINVVSLQGDKQTAALEQIFQSSSENSRILPHSQSHSRSNSDASNKSYPAFQTGRGHRSKKSHNPLIDNVLYELTNSVAENRDDDSKYSSRHVRCKSDKSEYSKASSQDNPLTVDNLFDHC
ncbi:hypothetical protein AAMO2058_000374500 [Amorphochlora amoebiformis]